LLNKAEVYSTESVFIEITSVEELFFYDVSDSVALLSSSFFCLPASVSLSFVLILVKPAGWKVPSIDYSFLLSLDSSSVLDVVGFGCVIF